MGSLLGGKAKSSTQNTVQVPAWLDSQNRSLVARAGELSNKAYTPYTGQRVAGFSDDSNSAFALNRTNTGKYDNLMNSASSGVQQLLARANGPSATDIQSLMNPYTQNVLDTSMRKAAENAGTDQAALKRQAGLAGGFGGSRFAVQQQKQSNDLTNNMNDIQYQGLSDAYNNAMNQWNVGTNTLNSGIGQALSTTQTGQQYDTNDIANLLKTGALQEERDQAQLDTDYADFDAEQAYPYSQLSWLSSIVNPQTGAYAGSTSTGTQSDGQSKLGKAVGIAASVAGMFSDERVKENIESVGKLDNGLTVYKYNYIGSPKTQIGIMAQEVEKTNPDAVSETKEGIKMVNYDEATKEDGYASGGAVSLPMLFEALKAQGTSAGSPNFSGAPSMKQDSGNPILDMISKGGGAGKSGSGGKSLMDSIGGMFGATKQYDNVIGPTMKADSSGFFGMGGNQGGASWGSTIGNFFGFADGGYVTNSEGQLIEDLLDTDEELARKRAQYEADKAQAAQPRPPLSDVLRTGADRFLQDAYTRSDYTKESPDDSYAKRLAKHGVHTTEALLPLLMGKGLHLEADVLQGGENLYDNIFVKPMSQLDAERAAAKEESGTLTDKIQGAITPEQQINSADDEELMMLPPGTMGVGPNGAPKMGIDPKTGAPMMLGVGMGERANGAPMNLVPQVMDGQMDGSMDGGEDAIMQLLKKQFMPKEQPKPQSEEQQQGGVNTPLLMAGLAMMASKGDLGTALAEGMAAYSGSKANAETNRKAAEEELSAKEQKKIKNLLDYLRVRAYMDQVNKKSTGAITPYQQAIIEARNRGLDIQQQNADTRAKESGAFTSLFGGQEALTPTSQTGNLEEQLQFIKDFEAQDTVTLDASLLEE